MKPRDRSVTIKANEVPLMDLMLSQKSGKLNHRSMSKLLLIPFVLPGNLELSETLSFSENLELMGK